MDKTKDLLATILYEKIKRVEFLQKEINKELSRHWIIKIFTIRKVHRMMDEVDTHLADLCNPDYLCKLYEDNKLYIF